MKKKTTKKKIAQAFLSLGEQTLHKDIMKLYGRLSAHVKDYELSMTDIATTITKNGKETGASLKTHSGTLKALQKTISSEQVRLATLLKDFDTLSTKYDLAIRRVENGIESFQLYTETELEKIRKDLNELYWVSKTGKVVLNGNNVSSNLKVFDSNGNQIAGNVTMLKFSGTTPVQNADGSVTISVIAGGSFSENETPAGTVDGVNKVFTLANLPVAGSVKLYVNGQRLTDSGIDYTMSSSTITFVTAPPATSVIICDYRY